MAYYKQVRKGDSIHGMTADGPVIVKVKCGRACLEIEADKKTIKLSHVKREPKLTKQPRRQ